MYTLFNFNIKQTELILSKRYEAAYNICQNIPAFILDVAGKRLGHEIDPYNIQLNCIVSGCWDMSNVRNTTIPLALLLLATV